MCVFLTSCATAQSIPFISCRLACLKLWQALFPSISFWAGSKSFSSGPLEKKHDACKRLMWTTVGDKKVTGNNQTCVKKNKTQKELLHREEWIFLRCTFLNKLIKGLLSVMLCPKIKFPIHNQIRYSRLLISNRNTHKSHEQWNHRHTISAY